MEREVNADQEWSRRRRNMVDEQLRPRGIRDERVLTALREVPRERFCPPGIRHAACEDRALPAGHDQTISQPFIVAYMSEQLAPTPNCRVLEIGTGTGYQTAIISRLAGQVFSVERIETLHIRARALLAELGIDNVTTILGDGSLGLPNLAPFERILVTAAAPSIPESLVDQLADGGRLVLPVGGPRRQTIIRVVRRGKRAIETPLLACRFVKLIGEEGWTAG